MKENRHNKPAADKAEAMQLPADTELEAVVLGALLLEPRHVADVRAILPDENAFTDRRNAALYRIILDRDDRGESVDLVTITREAKAKDKDIPVAYVAGLTSSIGSGVGVLNHAHILAALATRRALCVFGHELKARAQGDEEELLLWALEQIDRISGESVRLGEPRSACDIIAETLRALERRQQAHQSGRCVGISSGLAALDRVTGGWRGGQLIVLAGRPAMGKTAVSLAFARAAAAAGTPVCYFSLEMRDADLMGRMLVGVSDVDADAFRAGSVTTDDWSRIEVGAQTLRPLPLYLVDRAGMTMADVRARCRAMAHKGRCGMVVIDYLQLLTAPSAGRNGNREREVAEMSRAAKLLAKELDVPVILLAQLSRKVEERADKTPMLSDLRESGAIEQDADMVIFIHRPAHYGAQTIQAGSYGEISAHGVGVLTIAKNREGCTGFLPFRHNESLTRIADYGVGPQNSDAW